MKIHSKNNKVHSTKLIVPIDGLITIDGNGVAEVSPKCGVLMVNNTNDWEFLKKEKDTEENVEKEPNEVTDEEPNDVEKEDNREILEKKLNGSTVKELQAMCVEAQLPEEEWKNLTKKLLVEYLMEKYDSAEG